MSTGYGRKHQELRVRMLPLAYGRPCARCGEVMTEAQDLDLDHNNKRDGYVDGLFSHRRCNRATAGLNARGFSEPQGEPQAKSVTRW